MEYLYFNNHTWHIPTLQPYMTLMWPKQMTCKKYSSVTLRVIFRIYMFGVLSRTLPSIFHQGLRSSELEFQIPWISPLLLPSLLSPPLLLPPLLSPPLLLLATVDSLTTVDGFPPSLATATNVTRNLPYANGCTGLLSRFKF